MAILVSAPVPETAQFTRYNDHSIAFDYPSGARVVNFDAPGGIALKIVWQVEDALIEIEINGNLSITKSAQERAATFFAAHDIRFNETDNVPPFPITLGEYPALRSRRRFVDGAGAPLIFDYAFVDTRKLRYNFEFAATTQEYEAYQWCFDRLLASFTDEATRPG